MTFGKRGLPPGWAAVRVDRVGVVRLGRQRSPDKHTGEHTTKYLRAANIKPAGLDLTDILEMDFTPEERVVFSLRTGDILLTEASGSSSQVGRAAMWRNELPECCYQNTIIRFRPHVAQPDYALVVFRHYAASGIFARVARGVGIQHLGGSRFAELQFPLPPLNEQKRIADAVGKRLEEIREAEGHLRTALDRLNAQRKEILATAVSGELLAPLDGKTTASGHASATAGQIIQKSTAPQGALFDPDLTGQEQLDGDLDVLPPAWVWVRIDQVGDVRIGRQRSPKHHHGEHVRPYLRVANVFEDRIDITDVHEMNFTPDEYTVYALEHGDILLNEGQSPELVGRPAIFRNELPGACFQNTLIRFRAGPAVDPEYALLVFMHYLHSGQFREIARWSTNIAHLGLDRFRSMPFPLPPLAKQEAIVKEARRRLDMANSQTIAVRASIERFPEMERELLAAAVAGELVSQVPEDESAAQLLDRLGVPSEDAAPVPAVKKDRKAKGDIVKPRNPSSPKGDRSKVQLSTLLKKVGHPLPLPELFALAGFDRDQPEQVELFYLALRSELDRTIRQTGDRAETGGEVTIHPDFKLIYAFLKENGVIVEVFTNGYAIDDEIVELFQLHPPSSVEVSLYSLDNSRLRNAYGVKDNLGASKVLENVLRMKRAGIQVACKTFVNTVTSADIESVTTWCNSNEIDHYSSFDITQAYDGTDLRTYQVMKNEPHALLRKSPQTAVCLPCKTKNYGSAINASFSLFPCSAIRLSDCTYDLREIGVTESIRRMKAFMRRFQDTQIQGSESGSTTCTSCMAFAKPVRNEAGELMHFAQP